MAYRPREGIFGPPLRVWLPSLLYLGVALAVVCLVVAAQQAPTNSWLFVTVVEGDAQRAVGSKVCATLLLVSAVSTVLRTAMRGVRVYGDGLELRDVVLFGWPRMKRYRWAEIDRIVLDQPTWIALDLWDGTRAFLPQVSDRAALSRALEKVGYMRAIPVRGGVGLDDLPEMGAEEG